MRIYFIHPSHYRLDGSIERTGNRFRRMPNLSLLHVSALTPANHEILYVEDEVEEPDYEADVDLVAISARTYQAHRAYDIAAPFRRRGIPVVLGGFHARFYPERSLQSVDSVVIGDAEPVWEQLLQDAERGQLQPQYDGTVFSPLVGLPVPRYDLLERAGLYYSRYPIQATRGCPLTCSFCNVTKFYRRSYRKRPVEEVARDLEAMPNRRPVFVDDDLFIAGRRYVVDLMREIEPLRTQWFAQTDIRSADNDEILEWAARAGCEDLYLGLESINPQNISAMDKSKVNRVEDYERIIRKIHSYGINTTASLMFGLEGDSLESFDQTLEWLNRNRVSKLSAYLLTPLPGVTEGGKAVESVEEEEKSWNLLDSTHNLVPHKSISRNEMETAYWRFLNRFYSFPSAWKRLSHKPVSWRNRLIAVMTNLILYRHDVRRRRHPFVGNDWPGWLAPAVWVRYWMCRLRPSRKTRPPADRMPEAAGSLEPASPSRG